MEQLIVNAFLIVAFPYKHKFTINNIKKNINNNSWILQQLIKIIVNIILVKKVHDNE